MGIYYLYVYIHTFICTCICIYVCMCIPNKLITMLVSEEKSGNQDQRVANEALSITFPLFKCITSEIKMIFKK